MKHPVSPCTADCPRHRLGCRGTCDGWKKYEAEMVTFNASKRVLFYTGNMTVGRKKVVESMKKG